MKKYFVPVIVASVLAISVVVIRQKAQAQNTGSAGISAGEPVKPGGSAAKANAQESSPVYVTEIPSGYRDWRLISVAHEEGSLNDIRAILGNDIAVKAYREGTLPFPEGAIIARIAWSYVSSEENNKTFGTAQSFIAGPPTNGVQFMVKDSKKYSSTGGWGYAHFNENDKKPAEEASMKSCFPCHQKIESRDFIFTRYSL